MNEPFRLDEALHRISHWLPAQAPLKDFIHHNTLHAFQDIPFSQAMEQASELFGARAYLPLSWYREKYRKAEISEAALHFVIERLGFAEAENILRQDLMEFADEEGKPLSLGERGIRRLWREKYQLDLDVLVQPTLFRLLSSFLDQGIAVWRMPEASQGFFGCVTSLQQESIFPLFPLPKREAMEILSLGPEKATAWLLDKLVGTENEFENYLSHMLLSHPGWSGMVHMIEQFPSGLLERRKISLKELVAVELLCEWGWAKRKLGEDFLPLGKFYREAISPPKSQRLLLLKRIWHEALEYSSHFMALQVVTEGQSRPGRPKSQSVSAQVFFCIDDRECSLRRHLEFVDPTVETYGTAGFFGVDCAFLPAGTLFPIQYCPVVVKPQYLIKERYRDATSLKRPGLSQLFHFHAGSNTLVRGWLMGQVLGIIPALRMALNIFRPGTDLHAEENLITQSFETTLQIDFVEDAPSIEGLKTGYTISEMADRVYGVLRNNGLYENFARLVAFIAHGSSSANNPHFSAYDCGACSGRPGVPNARAIAAMANKPQVRAQLRSRGLHIPDSTLFVGGFHDTARDEVVFFDTESWSESQKLSLTELEKNLARALKRNAQERSRRFEMAPSSLSEEKALEHVRRRAASIFEPRPELNHATNFICVVGRRSLTQDLFLDRRAFLNSYDPTIDPEGAILAGILGAVIPVCGGINLEYLFSRVDNDVYGAGTKLPHNVVSLVGVSNGVEGDLLTGLPSQMVEVHDPVRLLLIVEQQPEILLKVLRDRPALWEWVENEWIRLACFDPQSRKMLFFDNGRFLVAPAMVISSHPAPIWDQSLEEVCQKKENLPFALLEVTT